MTVIRIESFDDPRLSAYRDLPKRKPKAKSNAARDEADDLARRFVAEGVYLAERLIESDLKTESLLIDENRLDSLRHLLGGDVVAYVLPAEAIKQLVGFDFHRGVMACGLRPAEPSLDEMIPQASGRATIVACVDVSDAENIGSIVRNAAALGASGLMVNCRSADPFCRRSIRVSMGHVFCMPIVYCDDLKMRINELRNRFSFEVIATVVDQNANSIESHDAGPRNLLMLGSEADGLDRDWVELADAKVTIPMASGIDSLNVSAASAIILNALTSRTRRMT